jgi:predicted membrane protein
MHWIIGIIGFLCTSEILILMGLFYDHRRKPELALKYTLAFFLFLGIGLVLVFNYHIYAVILAPIFIWGYFFIMLMDSNARKKKLEKKKEDLLDNN